MAKRMVELDLARLNSMSEPFSVRIARVKGNQRTPIILPKKEDFSDGDGWSREEVKGLEHWMVNEFTGGGAYEITVVDANNQTLQWSPVWPIQVYPEKVPFTMLGGASPEVNEQTASAMKQPPRMSFELSQEEWPPRPVALNPTVRPPTIQRPVQHMSNNPHSANVFLGWGPNGQPVYGSPQNTPHVPQTYTPIGPDGRPMYSPDVFPAQPAPRHRRMRDDDDYPIRRRRFQGDSESQLKAEKEALEKRLAEAEAQRREVEFQQKMKEQEMRHEQTMAAQREEIRRLADTATKKETDTQMSAVLQAITGMQETISKILSNPQQKGVESEELRLLKQQMDQRERESERQAFLDKLAALESKLTQPKQDSALDGIRQQLEAEKQERIREKERFEHAQAMQKQQLDFERAVAELKNDRPDPMIQFLEKLQAENKESTRLQMETMRQFMEMQREGSRDRLSMSDIIALLKDNDRTGTTMINQIMESMGGIMSLYSTAAQNALQLTSGPPDSPVMRVLEGFGEKATSVIDQYLEMQKTRAVATAQAQVEQARAQADVQKAAFAAAHQQQQSTLNGPYIPQHELPNPTSNGVQYVSPQPTAPEPDTEETKDTIWFSPTELKDIQDQNTRTLLLQVRSQLLESITDLRENVMEFEKAMKEIGDSSEAIEESEVPGINPPQTVKYVREGMDQVKQLNINIRAYTELFLEERYAEFFDVLLPEASATYKEMCVQAVSGIQAN